MQSVDMSDIAPSHDVSVNLSAPPPHAASNASGAGGDWASRRAMDDVDREEWVLRMEATAATAQNDARNALLQVEQLKRQILASQSSGQREAHGKTDAAAAAFWLTDVATVCRDNASTAAATMQAVMRTSAGDPPSPARARAAPRNDMQIGDSILELFEGLSTDVAGALRRVTSRVDAECKEAAQQRAAVAADVAQLTQQMTTLSESGASNASDAERIYKRCSKKISEVKASLEKVETTTTQTIASLTNTTQEITTRIAMANTAIEQVARRSSVATEELHSNTVAQCLSAVEQRIAESAGSAVAERIAFLEQRVTESAGSAVAERIAVLEQRVTEVASTAEVATISKSIKQQVETLRTDVVAQRDTVAATAQRLAHAEEAAAKQSVASEAFAATVQTTAAAANVKVGDTVLATVRRETGRHTLTLLLGRRTLDVRREFFHMWRQHLQRCAAARRLRNASMIMLGATRTTMLRQRFVAWQRMAEARLRKRERMRIAVHAMARNAEKYALLRGWLVWRAFAAAQRRAAALRQYTLKTRCVAKWRRASLTAQRQRQRVVNRSGAAAVQRVRDMTLRCDRSVWQRYWTLWRRGALVRSNNERAAEMQALNRQRRLLPRCFAVWRCRMAVRVAAAVAAHEVSEIAAVAAEHDERRANDDDIAATLALLEADATATRASLELLRRMCLSDSDREATLRCDGAVQRACAASLWLPEEVESLADQIAHPQQQQQRPNQSMQQSMASMHTTFNRSLNRSPPRHQRLTMGDETTVVRHRDAPALTDLIEAVGELREEVTRRPVSPCRRMGCHAPAVNATTRAVGPNISGVYGSRFCESCEFRRQQKENASNYKGHGPPAGAAEALATIRWDAAMKAVAEAETRCRRRAALTTMALVALQRYTVAHNGLAPATLLDRSR
jgi:hypothetical protein